MKHSILINMLQVQVMGRVAAKVNSGEQRQPRTHALSVCGFTSKNVAILALLNQTISEVRSQVQGVIAIKAGERKLALIAELPVVRGNCEKGARVVDLAVIDGVAGNRHCNGDQSRDVGEAG